MAPKTTAIANPYAVKSQSTEPAIPAHVFDEPLFPVAPEPNDDEAAPETTVLGPPPSTVGSTQDDRPRLSETLSFSSAEIRSVNEILRTPARGSVRTTGVLRARWGIDSLFVEDPVPPPRRILKRKFRSSLGVKKKPVTLEDLQQREGYLWIQADPAHIPLQHLKTGDLIMVIGEMGEKGLVARIVKQLPPGTNVALQMQALAMRREFLKKREESKKEAA